MTLTKSRGASGTHSASKPQPLPALAGMYRCGIIFNRMTSEELKNWRELNNLSQSQLAERLPVSIRTLQGWEQGRFKIPEFLERALRDIEKENEKTKSKKLKA